MDIRFPFGLLLVLSTASAAPTAQDLQHSAVRVTEALGGVLRTCPTSFAKIGSPDKRCVGTGENMETVRGKLSSALGKDLYGVWLSKDEQRTVYNWVNTAGGYVYLRLQPDPDGRAQTLIYLDVPPSALPAANQEKEKAPAEQLSITPTPKAAAPKEAAPKEPAPEPKSKAEPSTPTQTLAPAQAEAPRPSAAPLPFTRTLQLQQQRMHGPDVLAAQNRLITLIRPVTRGKGDGWYGPVTTATVKAFQKANGLPATGKIDRTTWNLLFSPLAKPFEGVK